MEEELYKTVFKRKSIRKFKNKELDNNLLNEIKNYLSNLEPLFPEIKTEYQIINSDDLRLLSMKKAPHYLAFFSENKENHLVNAGFILQQFDLFLSSKNIGSCWQGIPRPKKHLLNSSNLDYIIVIAFGESNEEIHRQNIKEFKRKNIHEITNIENYDEILELVRLAPSSRNRQPWYFTGTKEEINVYCRDKLLTKLFLSKLTLIDIGISIFHLNLAIKKQNKKIKIIKKDVKQINNYKYILSLKIN